MLLFFFHSHCLLSFVGTCQRVTGIVERRAVGKRYAVVDQMTKEYCYSMRDFFEWMLLQKNRGPPLHGEVSLNPLKKNMCAAT